VPNTITPQELQDLHLPDLNRRLVLKRAGWIQPSNGQSSCEVSVDDIAGCVLYCEVVDGHAMKFGTTGSLRGRQGLNAGTINKLLAFQDGRYRGTNRKITDASTYDKYKRLAPQVIRGGQRIEIWATSLASRQECQHPLKLCDARCDACKGVEGALNDKYETLTHGWASRRN
jgi:hypothetical protein